MSYSNYPDGVNGSHPYFNPDEPPECRKCHAEVDEEWAFCPWCGAELRGDDGLEDERWSE
jgi:predicted amidophosphoribosyltransferase